MSTMSARMWRKKSMISREVFVIWIEENKSDITHIYIDMICIVNISVYVNRCVIVCISAYWLINWSINV